MKNESTSQAKRSGSSVVHAKPKCHTLLTFSCKQLLPFSFEAVLWPCDSVGQMHAAGHIRGDAVTSHMRRRRSCKTGRSAAGSWCNSSLIIWNRTCIQVQFRTNFATIYCAGDNKRSYEVFIQDYHVGISLRKTKWQHIVITEYVTVSMIYNAKNMLSNFFL